MISPARTSMNSITAPPPISQVLNDVYRKSDLFLKDTFCLETLTAEIIAIGSELLAPDRTDTTVFAYRKTQ